MKINIIATITLLMTMVMDMQAADLIIAGTSLTKGTATTNEEHKIYVVSDEDEGNVITKSQVAAAKQRGWTTYYYAIDENGESGWMPYSVDAGGDVNGDNKVNVGDIMAVINVRRQVPTTRKPTSTATRLLTSAISWPSSTSWLDSSKQPDMSDADMGRGYSHLFLNFATQ